MHYFFLDASALGKRYVVEIGPLLVNHLLDTVPKERLMALLLALGEVISILVRRKNAGDIAEMAYRQAMVEFCAEVAGVAGIPHQSVSDDLVRTSLPLIEQHSLNATDAMILRCALQGAEALRASGDDLVLVPSDTRLSSAAQASGLLVWNPARSERSSLDALIAFSA